ncbi:3692_t:CDS:10, partial [Ambispora leptoticha]
NDKKRDWYLQSLKKLYRTKIENCCPKNYDKAKKKALEMEEYNRDKTLKKHKDSNIPENPQLNLLDVDECGDIRAFEKRKKKDEVTESFEPLGKRGKIKEPIQGIEQAKLRKNLFKWLPKARSELTRALTQRKKETISDQNVKIRIVQSDLHKNKSRSSEVVSVWLVKINRDTVKASIDPSSRINLMLKRYAVKRGLEWNQVCVDMEGIIVRQGFYVMETASFEVLLGMPWNVRAQCSLVPRSWVSEVLIDNHVDEIDSDDDSDFDNVDDIIVVRRIDVEEPKELNEETQALTILNKAKNRGKVDDRLIDRKDILVVSRLTMENMSEVFIYELRNIGKTNLIEYEIRTGDMVIPSIRLHLIRINNPETRKIFADYLRQMIECGLLEKGSGEYAYHCFPVQKKKDETDKIRAVDVFKGYWQIDICEKDLYKVAVATSLGVLRYTKNVAAAYQNNIEIWTNESMEEHLETFVELAERPEENNAFELLKQKLSEEVILKASNWQAAKHGQKPYHIYTDTCDTSVGVVLEQEDNEGCLKPVSFDSRKLYEHELHYIVTKKECLEIMFGCHINERYVTGTVFDVWVDHQTLEWLFNKVELKDGMSRYPALPNQCTQTNDDFVKGLLYCVGLENQKINDLFLVKQYLQQLSWKLHKRAPPRRVVLEDCNKQDIVKACYKGLANKGGHQGINRTLTLVKIKYV